MLFAQGDLKVSLLYEEQEFLSLTTTLQSGEPAAAETPLQPEPSPEPSPQPEPVPEPTPVLNRTPENITEIVAPALSDVERAVLEREFG